MKFKGFSYLLDWFTILNSYW
uniref:Uncharacterized protein n=1 Tax=Arundo donax TaxID=35708 RepID=A0A0A8Z090_ARUDO